MDFGTWDRSGWAFGFFYDEFAETTEVTEKNGVLEFLSDE